MYNKSLKSFNGFWWLPENSNDKIIGTLSIDDFGNTIFYTIQSFEKNTLIGDKWHSINSLFGVASSNIDDSDHFIQIFDLNKIQYHNSTIRKHRYRVGKILIGDSSALENNLSFDTIMLHSELWNTWVNGRGIKVKHIGTNRKLAATVSYLQPKAIDIYKDKKNSLYAFFRGKITSNWDEGFAIQEKAFLNLKFKNHLDINSCINLKNTVERFIMLMIEEIHFFQSFELKSVGKNNYTFLNKSTNNTSNNFCIKFDEFVEFGKSGFDVWLKLVIDSENLINTFFFAFSNPTMDVYNKFLNYVFCLELYHRTRICDTRPLSEKNDRLFKKSQNETTGDVKSWLKKVLSENRDIPIDQRLEELIAKLQNKSGFEISKSDIARIKKTRHYLVHLDNNHKDESFSPAELIVINKMLSVLFLRLLKQELLVKKNTAN